MCVRKPLDSWHKEEMRKIRPLPHHSEFQIPLKPPHPKIAWTRPHTHRVAEGCSGPGDGVWSWGRPTGEVPEPSISCNPVDGAHQGLSAGRQRPPPPSRPRRPRGNAWQSLTERVSPRTGRGEAAASQPWRSGCGSEASAGRGCPGFPPAQVPRLPPGCSASDPAGREGQVSAPSAAAPTVPAPRGARGMCPLPGALRARGGGMGTGGRWRGALLAQPETHGPPAHYPGWLGALSWGRCAWRRGGRSRLLWRCPPAAAGRSFPN